jgi:hypothetical protein
MDCLILFTEDCRGDSKAVPLRGTEWSEKMNCRLILSNERGRGRVREEREEREERREVEGE